MRAMTTSLTKELGMDEKQDERNVVELLMDLAEDGSGDRASAIPEKDASKLLSTPDEKEAATIPPPPNKNGALTTSEKPTDSK